jgi:glucokinase
MILAGDIGGTNSRLAIFDLQMNKLHEQVYKNAGRSDLEGIIDEFLTGRSEPIDRACFAVAGPVSMGRVTLTNLSWQLDEQAMSERLKIARVALVNDLVGHAEGIEVLTPERVVTLHAGEPMADGNRAIIAAGTGLGEAGLVFQRRTGGYRSFASEGGHCDYAPRDELEDKLLAFLRNRIGGPVSFENVLSGRGLRNLYDFTLTRPEFAGKTLPEADPQPAAVTAAALDGSNPSAAEAMRLFVSIYGQEAGHLALKTMATGGLYVGGGIAPRILSALKQPAFLESFRRHSVAKMQAMLTKIPVHVINFDMNGLYGAANYARSL